MPSDSSFSLKRAGGKAGVAKAIDILKNELSVTMALTGTNKISEIGRQVIMGGEGRRGQEAGGKEAEISIRLILRRARHAPVSKDGAASSGRVPRPPQSLA